jgi:hypothetical protein
LLRWLRKSKVYNIKIKAVLRMLYYLGKKLVSVWGPFRLLTSHLMLLAMGTLFSGLIVWTLLPKLWDRLPSDCGKALAADGGIASKGKPTGGGAIITLLALPVIVLFVPMDLWQVGVLLCLYISMSFGYLDDRSADGRRACLMLRLQLLPPPVFTAPVELNCGCPLLNMVLRCLYISICRVRCSCFGLRPTPLTVVMGLMDWLVR